MWISFHWLEKKKDKTMKEVFFVKNYERFSPLNYSHKNGKNQLI